MQKAETLTSVNRTRSRGFFANRQNVGLLFALPAVLFSVVFFVIPLIMTVFMSFHDWPLLGEHHFIGLDNYVKLASDGQFWNSLWFTTRYTVVITPIIFILAFILASLVNLPLRFIGFFRTAFFLPVVIGLGTSSLLWVWLLNDRVGAIDGILLNLKLIPRSIVWLGESNSAMTWIIISVVWKTVGFTMVLLLTGMQAIPEELYQQAMVDGAGVWEKFRFITLPLLRRTVALAMVLSVIGSYLGFDQFFIMTRGGPQNTTISVVYWIFNNSFTYFRLGYGAALSIVLLVILVILSVVQLRLLRDETQY